MCGGRRPATDDELAFGDKIVSGKMEIWESGTIYTNELFKTF
jgi:hypothetical protein